MVGKELYELHGSRPIVQRISRDLHQPGAIGFPCDIGQRSDIAWKTNPDRLVQIAGYSLCNRPSAVQFIEFFSNYIQRNHMNEEILN